MKAVAVLARLRSAVGDRDLWFILLTLIALPALVALLLVGRETTGRAGADDGREAPPRADAAAGRAVRADESLALVAPLVGPTVRIASGLTAGETRLPGHAVTAELGATASGPIAAEPAARRAATPTSWGHA